MSVTQEPPSGSGIADQIQENMLAYFRLFAGLPGITVADADVFWLVSARGEPGNHLLRAQIPGDAPRQCRRYADDLRRPSAHDPLRSGFA